MTVNKQDQSMQNEWKVKGEKERRHEKQGRENKERNRKITLRKQRKWAGNGEGDDKQKEEKDERQRKTVQRKQNQQWMEEVTNRREGKKEQRNTRGRKGTEEA